MSSFTVPYEGGTRVACTVCPWYSAEAASALIAEGKGARHDRAWHPEGEAFTLAIENAGMVAGATHPPRVHIHGPQCTQESCGLVRFKCSDERRCNAKIRLGYEPTDCEGHLPPTREELTTASVRRKNG